MQIKLGALSDPISKQIADAGFESDGKSADLLDRLAKAITIAHIHGCLTDGECDKARKRLVKQIRVRPNTQGNAPHEGA